MVTINNVETKIQCDFCKGTVLKRYNKQYVCAVCKKDVCPNCRATLTRYVKEPNDTYNGYVKQLCFLCFDCLHRAFPKIKDFED